MKTLKRRILSAVTALAVAAAGIGAVPDIGIKSPFIIAASAQGEVSVSTWAELKAAVDSAQNGAVIRLTQDVTNNTALANSSQSVIKVGSGKNITIDLNGKTMNRNRKGSHVDGEVLLVNGGTLTVKNGTLTGGWASSGGGIYSNGTLTMTGGALDDNQGIDAGGIFNNTGSAALKAK
ncbi:MAG: hypothetical protein K5876_00465 [Ruminiclostridium sp.]|nr:hypothetical protein [Ruminiclostridium sp.]